MDDRKYHDLVLAIYQAVSEPELWADVLDRIRFEVSAHGCIIWEYQSGSHGRELHAPFMTNNYNRLALQSYVDEHMDREFVDHDLFEARSLESDDVELVSETDLFPDQNAYLELPHVKDMMNYGIRHRYGGILNKDNTLRGRFSIQRSKSKGVFTAKELNDLNLILPHVAKALDLGAQLDPSHQDTGALLTLINKLTIGACLVDADGFQVESNDLFKQHFESFRAFRKEQSGCLSMTNPANQLRFNALLSDVRNHGRFGARPRKEAIIANAPDRIRTLCIEVVPCDSLKDIGSKPFNGVWILTRDTMEPISIDTGLVRDMFKLTDAECGLVDLLCEGLSNAQIAERRERSQATINTQVKSILNKSRAVNRTQFVRLLCNFSVPKVAGMVV